MGRWAPRFNLRVQVWHQSHELKLRQRKRVGRQRRVLQVRQIKVVAFFLGRVSRMVQKVRRFGMVIRGPFVKVIRDVKRGGVR